MEIDKGWEIKEKLVKLNMKWIIMILNGNMIDKVKLSIYNMYIFYSVDE